jgi:hypothetical protein
MFLTQHVKAKYHLVNIESWKKRKLNPEEEFNKNIFNKKND